MADQLEAVMNSPMQKSRPARFDAAAARRDQQDSERRGAVSIRPMSRPAWLPERVWPFEGSSIEVDGSTIAFTDVGSGPVLLLAHTGMWSLVWRDMIARLAGEFRCIALDAPGTGRSGRLPSREIGLARASRAISAVVEALELKSFTLVAHDLGGPAGIAAAARVAERVNGIVAINSFGWRPSGPLFRGMLALMGSTPMREIDALTGFLPRITATSFGVGRQMDAESVKAFRAGVEPQARRAFHSYLRDARHCDALYGEITAALGGALSGLPLLTIFGERNDPLGFQPQWKKLFPDARQVVVSKGNHFPMCDDPELVSESIRGWHRECVEPGGVVTG
jgi:pimeloyl-ACP methyl ester carboxylesterase